MDKAKDLSDFDKGQIMMAKRLGQSVSKTADLVGCSRFAVLAALSELSEDNGAVYIKERSRSEKTGRVRARKDPQPAALSETSQDNHVVSTKEKGGTEKKGRARARKNPQPAALGETSPDNGAVSTQEKGGEEKTDRATAQEDAQI